MRISCFNTNGKMKTKKEKIKPTATITGEDGNIFNLLAICNKALKKAGQNAQAKEMSSRVFASGGYDKALEIMGGYCELR